MSDDEKDGSAVRDPIAAIRETAKWLSAAFGAVGAALVAGSQVSDLGHASGTLLVLAFVGAALGLGGVLGALWALASVLTLEPMTLTALAKRRDTDKVVAYFAANPELLRTFPSIQALQHQNQKVREDYRRHYVAWEKAETEEGKDNALLELNRISEHAMRLAPAAAGVLEHAHRAALWYKYRTALRIAFACGTATSLGVVLFSYAAGGGKGESKDASTTVVYCTPDKNKAGGSQ